MMKRWAAILVSATVGAVLLYQLVAMASDARAQNMAVTLIDLGTLGGVASQAADLNEARQVVGNSTLSATEKTQGFMWSEGTMEQLAVTAELPTMAAAINEQGLVVGAAVTGPDADRDQRPVLWQDGAFVPLNLLNTLQGSATAVNDQGLIAGQTISETTNALLIWRDAGDYVLSATVPFSGGIGTVYDLNNQGQIVGRIDDGPEQRAFLWQDGVFADLPTLGGSGSAAYAINDLGQIAGSSAISGALASQATLWVDGLPQQLGGLGEAPGGNSRALGLNNKGLVVGDAEAGGETHAVVWVEGAIVDLNDFLPEDGPWDVLQTAVAVDDAGWIAGTGLQDGRPRAFLLYVPLVVYKVYLPIISVPKPTPTPEPTPTPAPSPTPPPGQVYDMMRFMARTASNGFGPTYEVEFTRPDGGTSQSRHQTQAEGPRRFFHTKGVSPAGGDAMLAEWEELWEEGGYIYRGTDTSPGNKEYYTQFASSAGPVGARWSPRFWRVGDVYERNPYVIFFRKADCGSVRGGSARTWLRFDAYYPQRSFTSSQGIITLNNVVQLSWLLSPNGTPEEKYYYAEGYGLVAWESRSNGRSRISEEVARLNNVREFIPCLQSNMLLPPDWVEDLGTEPLPLEYLLRVK